MKISFQKVLLLLILAGSLFVRTYRIADFSTFRGDQGNTGVILHDAVKSKTLPLVGPTVSTGQLPGPAYYYLVAIPLLVSNFNPMVPAVLFAILGVITVYLLYWVGSRMFGVWPGLFAASLRAFSPIAVEADRTMWNPTAIPFFVLLIIIALYKIHENKKPWYLLIASFSIGIAIQLHYTNALWIPILIVFWFYETLFRGKKNIKRFVIWGIGAVITFILPLSTFLYYEALHHFADIESVAFLLVKSHAGGEPTRFLIRVQHVTAELFSRSLPALTPSQIFPVVITFILIPIMFRKNFWATVFAFVVGFNIFILSLYKGPLFLHYLKFSASSSFLLIAGVVAVVMPKRYIPYLTSTLIFLVVITNIPRIQLTRPQVGEYAQTSMNAAFIMSDAGNEAYAFGLISSPSYSDYHYRFFFHLAGRDPLPVTSTSYKKLYLACDDTKCPPHPFLDIASMRQVQMFCFDLVCKDEYPVVDLTKFGLTKTAKLAGSTIYLYERY